MYDALMTLLPFLLFMFIPVWIPIVTEIVGRIADLVRPGSEIG